MAHQSEEKRPAGVRCEKRRFWPEQCIRVRSAAPRCMTWGESTFHANAFAEDTQLYQIITSTGDELC